MLHLLRHGPPLRTGLLLGHSDEPPLERAMPVLHARVRSLAFDKIIASDLSRAAIPAARIADDRGLPLHLDPRWRELAFGAWDGLPADAIAGDALNRFWSDPDANPPPGGERWSQLRARIRAALAGLSSATLIVTHAGAMRAALAELTGLDHRGVWALDLPYGALLSLRIWPGAKPAGQVTGLLTEGA